MILHEIDDLAVSSRQPPRSDRGIKDEFVFMMGGVEYEVSSGDETILDFGGRR